MRLSIAKVILSGTFLFVAPLQGRAAAAAPAAPAADACAAFKWNVAKEHALFSGQSSALSLGKDAASAPMIETDRLYTLSLAPQSQVAFALAPGKRMISDGAYAGIATFRIDTPGAYRVSVDVPFWIDIIVNGKLVATKDFTGQQGCDSPRKIVEYDLIAAPSLILQVSGATKATVRLTVTQSPTTP